MKHLLLIPVPALCLLLLLLGSGCETEPSEQVAVSITPNSAQLKRGQSQEFSASGWEDYTWSLSNPGIGVLSSKKGNSTVYTAVAGSNDVQILSLSVSVRSGTTTNLLTGSTGGGPVTAEALIQHVP